jgi:hypothetical protein
MRSHVFAWLFRLLSVCAGGLNTDVTGLIVNQSIEEKAVIALKEKSVFPAPVSAVPGSQLGGWCVGGVFSCCDH